MRTSPDDLRFFNTTGILQKKKTMWFIRVEVEQETSAPPPKKNPGSAREITTKHASDSPVMFVTHKRFAVIFFLPSCCVNSLLLSAINN